MTLWAAVFSRRKRSRETQDGQNGHTAASAVPEIEAGPPALVEQRDGLLLIRDSPGTVPGPDDIAEVARALAAAEDTRQISTLVIAAGGQASPDLWRRCADTLDALRADGVGTVRLVLSGAGESALERTAFAQQVADGWDMRVIAPEESAVIVPGGSLFAPGPDPSSPGWQLFVPGGEPAALGPRQPAPSWQRAVEDLPGRTATGCVVEPIPAGVLVRSPREPRPTPDDLCYAVPVDPEHPLVLVGTAGAVDASPVPADDLSALIAALPAAVRSTVRLASGNHRDLLPVAQDVANSLEMITELLSGMQLFVGAPEDPVCRPVLIGRNGAPTWAPFMEAVVCLPTAADDQQDIEPRLMRWRHPLAEPGGYGGSTLELAHGWQASVTWSGLHLWHIDAPRPPLFRRALTPDHFTLEIGTPGREVDESLYSVLSRLLFDLDPALREYATLRVLGALTDGGRRLRRLSVRHGVRLIWAEPPAVAPAPVVRGALAVHTPPAAALPARPVPAALPAAASTDPDAEWLDQGSAGDGEVIPVQYRDDVRHIVRLTEEGSHRTAAALAASVERRVSDSHGAGSASALQARQLRAHVARVSGDLSLATDLYRAVAERLLASLGASHPETERAAASADACWRSVPDPADARRLGPALLALYGTLPGPGGRRLRAARLRLAELDGTTANPAAPPQRAATEKGPRASTV